MYIRFSLRTAFVGVFALCGVFALIHFISLSREAARKQFCRGCQTAITLDLQSYVNGKGHLPPAIIRNAAGEPLHSWRTETDWEVDNLSSPSINWRTPWNSPENLQFANDHLLLGNFCCNRSARLQTTYFVVVGEETAFPPTGVVDWNAFRDGRKNTVLVIEANMGPFLPMEPRDIRMEELEEMYGNWNRSFRLANHLSANPSVIFADFAIARIGRVPDWHTFRALFTIAGADGTNRTQLVQEGYVVDLHGLGVSRPAPATLESQLQRHVD